MKADELREWRGVGWWNALMLLVWLVAAVTVFVPFARDTSALDAVTLHVPGNQGNWWHVLVGVPLFLAFPMLWLRLRALSAKQLPTRVGRRVLWVVIGLSLVGTVLVELPFLRHLAGTSEWQRLVVLGLGLGIALVCTAMLWVKRRSIAPMQLCIAGIETAYLANAALCLVVYAEAMGPVWSRLGWLVTMGTVWPMALDLVTIFTQSFRAES
ncbi:hypothetical protein ACFPT7_00525 [Acidicapsa dinghuensis]|uniref:DUF2306 domain-containing protein n=1 Tax=Acidicapsa dinghuensis TaxID=2218256 RepID=A0ABW1E9Z8_9BACT|nr:hypothetical protein [Acidicapsa dinghuensis]